ncbi:MAG: hypothetical protein JNL39_18380, partial [Opitutaceae bacterium]|nr:hypothetical protein [Opitutaceae bacterium]
PEIPKAQCEALEAATLPPVVKDALARAYHARVATAVVREPQNTWSNLAFVFAGALVFARDRRVFPRLLGAALIALGSAGGALAMTAAVFRNDVRLAGIKPFDSTYTTIGGVAAVFVLLAAGLLIATRQRVPPRRLAARLGLLAVVVAGAAFCQLHDRPGLCLCAPDGLVQGHAIWHVLMAGAAALAHDLFCRIESALASTRAPAAG